MQGRDRESPGECNPKSYHSQIKMDACSILWKMAGRKQQLKACAPVNVHINVFAEIYSNGCYGKMKTVLVSAAMHTSQIPTTRLLWLVDDTRKQIPLIVTKEGSGHGEVPTS